MATYVIGDLQGCAHETQLLLDRIAGDAPGPARILFVGDLVNRGPDSIGALRRLKALQESGQAEALLGNHDLHLLALAEGFGKLRADDTLDGVLGAPDRDELLDWVRHLPMTHGRDGFLLVHAGLLPQWTAERAHALGQEVERALRGANYQEFLSQLYGSKPDRWDESLAGIDRLRVIVNAMTRMRFCSSGGVMEFQTKGEASKAPSGYMPWFDVPNRQSATATILFGHWSALGLLVRRNLLGLDTGCVWGGQLTAVRLEDRAVFACHCEAARNPLES